MKIKWHDEHGATLTAENPDESVKELFLEKFKAALLQEWQEFMQEVQVAMRKLKPGETVVLESKPVKVTLEKPPEEVAPTPDDYLKRES